MAIAPLSAALVSGPAATYPATITTKGADVALALAPARSDFVGAKRTGTQCLPARRS